MSVDKASEKMKKGHIRCFNCRKTYLVREGGWHKQDNQQIFLCLNCARTLEKSQPKAAELKKTHSFAADY